MNCIDMQKTSHLYSSLFNHRALRLFLLTAFAVLLSSCSSQATKYFTESKLDISNVVLISIDGLRPDAINKQNAEHLIKLTKSGLYFPNAKTIQRSVTLPSHISMLTGLDIKQHKVSKNKSLPGHLSFPTILEILKSQGKKTAALYSKKKLGFLFPPGSVDYIFGPGQNGIDYNQANANQLAAEFARIWNQQNYHFTFIHIREPDAYGHQYGWMSSEYLNQAIPLTDKAIGNIINTISKGEKANNTLLIITADHGGKDKTHWSKRPEDLTIPWIATHSQLTPETITDTQVNIVDTAPTILHLFNAPLPKGIDGQVIKNFLP